MRVPVFNVQGQQVREIELAPSIFDIEPNIPVMHLALVRQQANARAGTHSTKTRAEVSRSGTKVWRQKGTGRARQGSRRAPHWVGGGIVFGPKPRKYTKRMPRQMRQLAIRSALASKAQGGRLVVIEGLRFDRPKTKEMANILRAVGVGDKSAVVLYNGAEDENVRRAASNLAQVTPLHWQYLNMRDVLGHEYLVVPVAALERIQAQWGGRGEGTEGTRGNSWELVGTQGTLPAEGAAGTQGNSGELVGTLTAEGTQETPGPVAAGGAGVEVPGTEGALGIEVEESGTGGTFDFEDPAVPPSPPSSL